jgi:hypothetical protein
MQEKEAEKTERAGKAQKEREHKQEAKAKQGAHRRDRGKAGQGEGDDDDFNPAKKDLASKTPATTEKPRSKTIYGKGDPILLCPARMLCCSRSSFVACTLCGALNFCSSPHLLSPAHTHSQRTSEEEANSPRMLKMEGCETTSAALPRGFAVGMEAGQQKAQTRRRLNEGLWSRASRRRWRQRLMVAKMAGRPRMCRPGGRRRSVRAYHCRARASCSWGLIAPRCPCVSQCVGG